MPTLEMSQEYGTTTRTAKNFLHPFRDWVIDSILSNRKEILDVIQEKNTLVISDIGCWDGSHFFEPLREILEKIRENFGDDFVIKVIYSDLASKPQGFLGHLLENPQLLGNNVEVIYFEHNFYKPLPYSSDITLCTLATHWLSRAPENIENANSLFPNWFEGVAREEVEKQAKDDLEAFFASRSRDTSVLVGLVNLIKIQDQRNQITFTAQSAMRFMDQAYFGNYKKEGAIPIFYRYSEDILTSAEKLGFEIARSQDSVFPCDYVEAYKQKRIDHSQLVDAEVQMAKAWSEGAIRRLLKADQVDDFYLELRHYFKNSPELYGSNYHIQFLIAKCKSSSTHKSEGIPKTTN